MVNILFFIADLACPVLWRRIIYWVVMLGVALCICELLILSVFPAVSTAHVPGFPLPITM